MKEIIINTPTGVLRIGEGNPTFIVAEMSANHLQSYDRACAIIKAAAECGVDAIKLQTYTPDTLTIDCDNEYFQINVNKNWSGKTLYELYKEAYTPWEWHAGLKEYAESLGLFFFSTPFDETAVDFLEDLNVKLYKIASFSTKNIPLLQKIGSTKKPVIMSRGLTSLEELRLAVKTLLKAGCPEVALLHCISSYPSTPDQMHLKTIPDMAKRFSTAVGLSDHTLSPVTPIAAVALGASIIEKHFTTSRLDGGPDASFSLEPNEMRDLVQEVRETEAVLGEAKYESDSIEKESEIFQQSIFVVDEVKKGEKFTKENIRIIRPGFGLKPRLFKKVLGKKALQNLSRGTPLLKEHIEHGSAI